MKIQIRPASPADIEACGRIIFESFREVSKEHNFPSDFPSVKSATQLAGLFIKDSLVLSIVAENDGSVIGCNFLHERHPIRSVGPICVDPDFQGNGIGRKLMEEVLNRAKGFPGIRLIRESLNTISRSLYISLGFEEKESLVLVNGRPKNPVFQQGIDVRPLTLGGENLCAELCTDIYGFERTQEVIEMLKFSLPFVAQRGDRLVAYASSMTMWMTNHCVARTEEDMKALILGIGKQTLEPLSFLVPLRYSKLLRWCLEEGFRIVKPFTLMSKGKYAKPNGIYFPSASY